MRISYSDPQCTPSSGSSPVLAASLFWESLVGLHASLPLRSLGFHRPLNPSGTGEATVLHTSKSASIRDWLSTTVRIRKGNYYSTAGGYSEIRIEVADVRVVSIPSMYRLPPKNEMAVELHVKIGGGLIFPGERTVFAGVNQYLVPRSGSDVSGDSLYAFNMHDGYFSATCISIMHINSHDACADVRIAYMPATAD